MFNLKNIKTKLLFWYSIVIIFVLSVFTYIVLNEFSKLVLDKKEHINTSIKHLENVLIIWVPALFIISILVTYFIIKRALEPVKKTINDVKNIEVNNLNIKLTSHSKNDEIEELVNTFNIMIDKINESFLKITRFSNDVSHELKTPLTIIRGNLELALRKPRTNNEYENIIRKILTETKELQELIDSLLYLSNTNNKQIKKTFTLVEIDTIITDIVSTNKQLIKSKNLNFNFLKFTHTSCYAQELLIKILISNIIQNAIKYSNNNSNIDISLSQNCLIIKDYGIGIEKKYLNNIFDRFYRIDTSRTKAGYGLGLSIVKSIANLHNFDIEIQSEYKKYTKFIINFNNT